MKLKNKSYSVIVGEPTNTCYSKQKQIYFGKNDWDKDYIFEFAPCAYLKENISNIACEGVTDVMVFFQSNQVNSFTPDIPWQFDGCTGFTAIQYSKVPTGKYNFKWVVTRSTGTTTFYDTITLSENEYRTYNLNY